MKFRILSFSLLILAASCSNQKKIPEKVTEATTSEDVRILKPFEVNKGFEVADSEPNSALAALKLFIIRYNKKEKDFDLNDFKNKWQDFFDGNDIQKLGNPELEDWFEITGLLFQLTGDVKYAEELERVEFAFKNDNSERIGNLILPFVYTRNVDHVHVNLFHPAEINYEHTLKGNVRIWQETDYPKSGSVKLNFNLEERKYIEIFIRIPGWADGATVTVKKVKYVANKGSYCKIAKKWKEGDLVEIEFPIEKIPEYLK